LSPKCGPLAGEKLKEKGAGTRGAMDGIGGSQGATHSLSGEQKPGWPEPGRKKKEGGAGGRLTRGKRSNPEKERGLKFVGKRG